MTQYPHFLFIKQVTEATQDAEGNWSDASESWAFHSICREQTNGKGSVVNGQDGKAIVFSSVIHLPITSERIIEGTDVLISASEDSSAIVLIQGQALKFNAGQLHNRLWV